MKISLTTRERQHLKARAHALEPRVQVGHSGLTDALAAEVDRALTAHELIKVKIVGDNRDLRAEIAESIAKRTDAALIQRVGKVVVLWRPRPEEDSGPPKGGTGS